MVFLLVTMFLLSGLLERHDFEDQRRDSDDGAQHGDGLHEPLRPAICPPSAVSACHVLPPFCRAEIRDALQDEPWRLLRRPGGPVRADAQAFWKSLPAGVDFVFGLTIMGRVRGCGAMLHALIDHRA